MPYIIMKKPFKNYMLIKCFNNRKLTNIKMFINESKIKKSVQIMDKTKAALKHTLELQDYVEITQNEFNEMIDTYKKEKISSHKTVGKEK